LVCYQQEKAIASMRFFLSNSIMKNVTVIGDSIAAAEDGWAYLLDAYGNKDIYEVKNHAVSGAAILDGMDAQVVASASDNADIIILALGTNDIGGDVGAATTEVEENIIELKTSNPNATLYYMNVLDRDADNETAIRAAIVTACTNQSITCWDTDGWIDPATDTDDGLHPNATGHAKILAEVLARI